MKIILIRHGESEANAKGIHQGQKLDVGLSERGKEQARKLAERLKNEQIEVIYTSDLKRACETAEEIAKEHNVKIVKDKRLRELDTGELPQEELFLFWRDQRAKEAKELGVSPRQIKFPGGESEINHFERVESFFNELIKKHNGTVVIVAHGGTNKVFFGVIGCKKIEEMYEVPQGNSAVNLIELEDNLPKFSSLNDLSHLGKEEKAIELFEKIREIPLRMPESLKDEDNRCWGKHRALKKELEEAGYKTKLVVCSFKWSEQGLPEEIIKLKHLDEDFHLFLKVKIHGAYFIVDASNDSQLPEYNVWDSLHDCKLAVKPIKIFSFEESELIEKKELEEFPERFKKSKEFYKAMNGFFERVRERDFDY